MNRALRFRKGDLLAIGIVLLLIAVLFFCFFPRKHSDIACAQIYCKGELIHTLPLDRDTVWSYTGEYTNTLTVHNGKIAVTHSDCPGGDCISCGWISGSGRSIVCLPNSLEIRIVGIQADVDFVVR